MERHTLDTYLRAALEASDARGRDALEGLRQRLDAAVLRVLLVGEAKRGKSTLGNALLGREVLPTGVRPLTSVSTTIARGTPERVLVRFIDGHQLECGLEELADYVTEAANPSNERGVGYVEGQLAQVPFDGFVLVDTPGVGSVHAHNTDEAHLAMDAMDVAVFVLTADPPVSASERKLLEQVRSLSVATFVVLNKADRLSPAEIAEAKEFAADVTGSERVFVCSARDALNAYLAGDEDGFCSSGVPALLGALADRSRTRGAQDLVTSVGRSAGRAVAKACDRVSVTIAAIDAVTGERANDVDLFAQELSRAEEGQRRARALAEWEQRNFRRRLDDDAARQSRVITRTMRDRMGALQNGSDDAAPKTDTDTGRAEERLREPMTEAIAVDVGSWRQQWLDQLDLMLADLLEQQQSDLDSTAHRVADAAARLLGAEIRLS